MSSAAQPAGAVSHTEYYGFRFQNMTSQASAVQHGAQARLDDVPTPELLSQLGTTPEGLSTGEVEKRISQYGFNELAEKRPSGGCGQRSSGAMSAKAAVAY